MVCTSLTVTAPAPTVTLSNVGFAAVSARLATCILPASAIGSYLYVGVDFVTTNNPSRIDINWSYTDPLGVVKSYTTYFLSPGASGTKYLACPEPLIAGNYTGLTATATATP